MYIFPTTTSHSNIMEKKYTKAEKREHMAMARLIYALARNINVSVGTLIRAVEDLDLAGQLCTTGTLTEKQLDAIRAQCSTYTDSDAKA